MRNLTLLFFLSIFLLLSGYLKSQDQIDFSDPDKIMATRTSLSVEKLMWIEGYKDKLMVKSFSHSENLGSEPNCYLSVELIDKTALFPYDDLLGKKLTVVYKIDENKLKYFNGYVSSVDESEYQGYKYSITLRTWLGLLDQTADFEVFRENQTVPQILSKIFSRYDFADYEFRLSKAYPKEKYVVQYMESDKNFILRQMSRFGMLFHFEHYKDKHVLVVTDNNNEFKKIESKIQYKIRDSKKYNYDPYGNAIKESKDEVMDLYLTRSAKVVSELRVNDYTYDGSRIDNIHVASKKRNTDVLTNIIKYDYPGEFHDEKTGQFLADTRLKELEMSEMTSLSGSIYNLYESVASSITINDKSNTRYNGNYIINGVSYSVDFQISPTCSTAEDYYSIRTYLTLVPDSIDLVSIRAVPKPTIPGVQTADVINAEPDKLGRILIKFHLGKDEKASNEMWVHTSTSAYPKKGDRVVVSFDQGNPDRPIVTGVMLKK